LSGTDTFTYTVEDTQNAISNSATVTVAVNAAPTANAGPDANAVTGQSVTLDGSGSNDPNGDTITFSWIFVSVPITSNLTDANIVNPTTPAPSFTPDVDGAYELQLTVSDGTLSDTDNVIITAATANVAPNADAGLDQNAEVGTLVTVDGSNSTDPDNGPSPLTFQWVFASVAPGSALTNADITTPTSPQASFTPTVANSGGNSGSRTKTNFRIECNGKNTGGCIAPTASPLTGSSIGTVVLIGNNGFSDMTGTVNNNVIDANHTPNLGGGNGIGGGNGVSGAGNAWTPNLTLTVTNNIISQTDGNGILLVGRGTSGIANLKIAGNNVAAPINAGGSVRPGIRVNAGNAATPSA
jgi:hypothetical protein